MNKKRLDEIALRTANATKGLWSTHSDSYGADHGREWEVSTENGHGVWTSKCQNHSDAEFIAHARQDIPDLLEYVASLEGILTRVKKEVSELKKELAEILGML